MLRCAGGTAGRSHMAACVGFKVAALIALMSAVAAITSANCAYMRPVSPGRKAAGRNTDISTSVMPMIGPNSWRMAALAASRPDMPFSMLWTAPSTTTMASSTTMPMASTIANRVEKLTVNPSAAMAAKAPMMVTGTVVAGISIARQSCRNTRTTMSTRIAASYSVLYTSWIDCSTKVVVSKGML
jgi:hypothetical protein